MKRSLFTILFCLTVGFIFGQVTNDYRSAVAAGTWNTVGSWERFDGATWVPAIVTPTNANAQTITILSGHTITVDVGVTTDQTLVESGATLVVSAVLLTVANGAALVDLTVNGTLQINGGNVATQFLTAARIDVNGTINNAGSVSNTAASRLFFHSGAVYNHQNTSPPGSVPSATWSPTSLCRITGNVDSTPGGLGQLFGNFEWNTPILNTPLDLALGGTSFAVAGDLSFVDTGGSVVILTTGNVLNLSVGGDLSYGVNAISAFTQDANATINVGGDFNFESPSFISSYDIGNVALNVTGDVNFAAGSFDAGASTGVTTISLAGDYTHTSPTDITSSGGSDLNLIFNGTGTQNFTSTFEPTFPINYTTANTSNLAVEAASYLAGSGDLTLGTGTSLTLLSVATTGALRNGTAGGNVQVTGTRTYTGGTIVYGGAARQFMSVDHPAAENTTINNAADVSMLGNVTINGALLANAGLLRIDNTNTLGEDNLTLTLGGNFTFNFPSTLGIRPSSSLIVEGTGTVSTLLFFNLSNNSMGNLTLDRDAAFALTNPNLTINGTFTQNDGSLAFGSFGATTLTLLGNFDQDVGSTISGGNDDALIIAGSGSISPTVRITGSLNTLTMNRNATLSLAGPSGPVVTNLNLTFGTVAPAGLLTMADGGTITRTFGTVNAAVASALVGGSYNVVYGSVNQNSFTGLELPTNNTTLNNLTLNNTFNVTAPNPGPLPNAHVLTLTNPVFVNGNLTITEGILATATLAVNLRGDMTAGTNGIFQAGTSIITFDGDVAQSINSVPALTLSEVVVNQPSPTTLAIVTQVNIQTRFAVFSSTTVNVTDNQLILLSDGTTTAFVPPMDPAASIVGSVVVQRFLPNTAELRAYRYLAPAAASNVADWQAEFPITGTFSNPNSGTFDGVAIRSAIPSFFYYDEAAATTTLESGYVAYPGTGVNSAAAPLEIGRGYAAFVRTDEDHFYDTRGTLGQGPVPIVVESANNGWNLIGNPYPAPIDWDLVATTLAGSVDNAIYFTDNTYNEDGSTRNISYVPLGPSVPAGYDGLIAQGQGFWVHADAGGGTVNFAETHKVFGQTNFIREAEIMNLLRVKMKNQNQVDEIAIRLHEDATDAFDGKYDAFKFLPSGLHISALTKDNEKLVINSISSKSCDNMVPIQIDGGVNGSYTLDFTGMETFDAGVTVYLHDKVLQTKTDLATTSQYAFTVTDVVALKNRFEILFDKPSAETALEVMGSSVCESSPLAYITVQNSQQNVKYTALWNGQNLSGGEVLGNGNTLEIPLTVENLPQGEYEITLSAQMSTCDAVPLDNTARISVVKKGVISSVNGGSVCEPGKVLIQATAVEAARYNWYEDIGDTNPIAGEIAAEFTTPVLAKTKTYYVAAVNALGCEGERVEVKATVINLEEVTIAAEGTTLTSSYDTGNQWYLDGLPIDNATSNQIEAMLSGIYTVVATVDGCSTTSAGREMTVTGMAETGANGNYINIYPNPTTDKVVVEVRSDMTDLRAELMSNIGVELKAIELKGQQGIKAGEFDLLELPVGIYMIRIRDGQKVYTKKISKIK